MATSTHTSTDTHGRTEADAVADVARIAAEPVPIEPGEIVALRTADGVHLVDLDTDDHRRRFYATPFRKVGDVTFTEPTSLCRYVESHGESNRTTIYADPEVNAFEAILNGHHAGPVASPDGEVDRGAGWGDHRAYLVLAATPEWQAWTKRSGDYMRQEEFAEFVEEHAPEIVEPDAATMLELASTFDATKAATMRSSVRLDSGQVRVSYEETVAARAGAKGDLVYPTTLRLGIAPFVGVDPYAVTARLRHRIVDGALRLAFLLDRPEAVVRDAFAQVAQAVEDETGHPVLFGRPRRAVANPTGAGLRPFITATTFGSVSAS